MRSVLCASLDDWSAMVVVRSNRGDEDLCLFHECHQLLLVEAACFDLYLPLAVKTYALVTQAYQAVCGLHLGRGDLGSLPQVCVQTCQQLPISNRWEDWL